MFLISASLTLVLLALIVGWLVPARIRLLVWTLIVIAGVVPWARWTDHSHWDRVVWVPFAPPLRLRDVVLNAVLYLPIGYFFASRGGGAQRRLGWAVLYGFILSLVTETTQVFSHGRFPTMTDVVTNTAGAALGAWAAHLVARAEASAAPGDDLA